MTNTVIFAIDDNTDLHTVAKFMRHMDTAKAVHKLRGMFVQCIGMYNGVLEPAYMMNERDYRQLVATTGYVAQQDCILLVPRDVRQPCTLEFPDHQFAIGPMREVSAAEAMQCSSWTYVQVTNKYFTTDTTEKD